MGVLQLQQITECHENAIEGIMVYDNFNRTRKLAMVLFLLNFVLLFIDYSNRTKGLWNSNDGYFDLFYSHVILGSVSLVIFLFSYKLTVSTASEITLSHKLYVILYSFFILCLTAVVSGLIDQEIHGQITVYIMGCIIIAVMFSYNHKVTALLYGLSCAAFMMLLTVSQKDPDIRQGNYINAFSIVVISYFISSLLYKLKQQDLRYKYYLEDLVTERTKELQTVNDLLSQEILERKRSEMEMLKLDRLNMIGEMAASISHEVRNPMTTVKGFLQLLRKKQESKDREYFDLMIEELDRANTILTEFLSIRGNKPTFLEWHNINDIVTSTLPLIQADAQTNDKLLTVELNDLPDIKLDIQEIRQLLLNLVRNGFEAMAPGGQLKIRTFTTNSEVALVVLDEGSGIEQCILEKLGTPFFTTKEQGTGLGLAVCYGIVLHHNGRISIETSSKGSAFYVYFKLSN
ncbi:MAG TPA: two-component sensor histidine kinase [Desulfosporosinus sp.]|nr:two-component sensor histidine kinase [Desulfosporosinus sp.]